MKSKGYIGKMKKYNIIYADPPWSFNSKAYQDSGRDMLSLDETQYKTMTIDDIKDLPIKNIINDNAACFLWCVDSHLKEGIEILENWGFKYKTIAFNWIKYHKSGEVCVNFAPWTLKSWEICLLGIKGKMGKLKTTNNIRGLINATRTKHSAKPDEVRMNIVKLFGDIPRIELFARQKTEGWDVWGNEVKSDINLKEILER